GIDHPARQYPDPDIESDPAWNNRAVLASMKAAVPEPAQMRMLRLRRRLRLQRMHGGRKGSGYSYVPLSVAACIPQIPYSFNLSSTIGSTADALLASRVGPCTTSRVTPCKCRTDQ